MSQHAQQTSSGPAESLQSPTRRNCAGRQTYCLNLTSAQNRKPQTDLKSKTSGMPTSASLGGKPCVTDCTVLRTTPAQDSSFKDNDFEVICALCQVREAKAVASVVPAEWCPGGARPSHPAQAICGSRIFTFIESPNGRRKQTQPEVGYLGLLWRLRNICGCLI